MQRILQGCVTTKQHDERVRLPENTTQTAAQLINAGQEKQCNVTHPAYHCIHPDHKELTNTITLKDTCPINTQGFRKNVRHIRQKMCYKWKNQWWETDGLSQLQSFSHAHHAGTMKGVNEVFASER